MATTVKWLEFVVHLTDKARVAELQALYPAGAKGIAPIDMATLQAAPIQETTENFAAPCTRSSYFIPGSAYPRDVAIFQRKSGGWFGLSFLFGDTTNYRWYATFAYAGGAVAEIDGVPTEIVAIAQRRGMMSFDRIGAIEHIGGNNTTAITRHASRHADGAGFAVREESAAHEATIDPIAGGAAASDRSWERFYMRVNVAPTLGLARFFRVALVAGANTGFSLDLTTDRRVQFKNIVAGIETGFSTTSDQLELGRWYRFDVLWKSGAGGANQTRVYLGRKLVLTQVITAAGGINTTSNHASSHLGSFAGWVTGDQPEMDFDDWVCADWPEEDSSGRYVGKDWLNGSRVKWIDLSAMGPGNAWTSPGDHRMVNANAHNVQAAPATSKFTSSVSGAALVATVNASEITAVPGAIGAVAFYVAAFVRQTVAGVGTIGWRFDGVLDLASLATQSVSYRWERRLFRPSGLTDPIENLTPLEVHHIKAANTDPADCQAFGAIVEVIGTFGEEDVPEDLEESETPPALPPRSLGTHNAPYPDSPWARATAPVQSPVVVHSGTYVGNGTLTELTFRSNVHWLFIRQVAAVAGNVWLSSGWGGHFEGQIAAHPHVDALLDPSFVPSGVDDTQEQRCIVRLVGDAVAWNQNASTYEYIAVMDPGARLLLNGQFTHDNAVTSILNALAKATFTPEYTLFQSENVSGSTYRRAIKGLGHAAPNGSILNLAENATTAEVTVGEITSLATLHPSPDQPALYSAWRRDDGSDDPNRFKVVKIGSYIGNGTASRTIGFENATGLRPLFAIVTPHNALSYFRDPSNLTNTSNAMGIGTSSTTAITGGGIDSFDVGVTLNANGIVYEYFVLLGSATAGNGGWSIDGEFAYIEPDWIDAAFVEPPDFVESPPVEDPDPDPGPDDADDCADGAVCVAATTRIVNLSLLEIGSLQVLENYCTQQTKEAKIAQEVYEQCVRHTLITYPWPFATKYAVLALTAAQPSNQDWTFAYRMPVDCIFPRRISVARGSAVDPSPPAMGLSSDAAGGIILSNEANAVLEYTARPECVGFNGDDLFREALKWRLAAALAPPLTRIPGEADRCLKMFEIIVQKAESVVKQGVPGLRPAASTLDVTAAALAANVQVVNRALIRIGARTITNLTTEQSREVVAAKLVFEDELRSVLRDFPWAFATRYLDPATLVDGEEGDPATPDWTFSHRLPTDFVFLRRLVLEGTGRSFDPDPFPFRLASDAAGGLLYSNVEAPVLEYTARLQNLMVFADPVFSDAFGWRLAATLAPSLANVELHRPEQHGRGPETPQDPTRRSAARGSDQQRRVGIAQWAWAMYERTLLDAKVADRNESQPEPHGDAEWIRARQ